MKILDVDVQVGDEQKVGGLSVFPVLGSPGGGPAYITGPEAFAAGVVHVAELVPPQVPFLEVTNAADLPLLLLEGEMLVGGDQNRTMNVSVLIPAGATTTVPVSCVEQGRWGAQGRRAVAAKRSIAPGTLRAKKVASLMRRDDEPTSRMADQHLVWDEVHRYEYTRGSQSVTAALDDLQEQVEAEVATDLERLQAAPGQVGVICTVGDQVVGFDLFDKPATLEQYLRPIVSGHALDVFDVPEGSDPIAAIERFLADIAAAEQSTAGGVALGDEVVLGGTVTGIGLALEGTVVHLAAFPAGV